MTSLPEEWRPVVGAESRYEVSNLGRVKSLKRIVYCGMRNGKPSFRSLTEKVLKPSQDQHGYAQVLIASAEGEKFRTKKVHHLVAAAFLGPKPKGTWVLHGPNGRNDNSALNLYYGTPKQNMTDKWRDGTMIVGELHHKTKLTQMCVVTIRRLHTEGRKTKDIAAMYPVGLTAIYKIISNTNWKWLN